MPLGFFHKLYKLHWYKARKAASSKRRRAWEATQSDLTSPVVSALCSRLLQPRHSAHSSLRLSRWTPPCPQPREGDLPRRTLPSFSRPTVWEIQSSLALHLGLTPPFRLFLEFLESHRIRATIGRGPTPSDTKAARPRVTHWAAPRFFIPLVILPFLLLLDTIPPGATSRPQQWPTRRDICIRRRQDGGRRLRCTILRARQCQLLASHTPTRYMVEEETSMT